MVASTGGVRVALHDLGGPDDPAAPTLLFAHATGFHGLVWAPTSAALTDRYRCLALDLRGHGMSETPDGASLSWQGMGDDVLAVLDSDRVPLAQPGEQLGPPPAAEHNSGRMLMGGRQCHGVRA